MPPEYKNCVRSVMNDGKSRDDAERICAISFFKSHGMTPQQFDKQQNSSTEYTKQELYTFDMVELFGEILGYISNK